MLREIGDLTAKLREKSKFEEEIEWMKSKISDLRKANDEISS